MASTHPLLLQALYDYVPSTSDLQPLLTWLSTMERAHVNLGRCRQGPLLGRGRGSCLVSDPSSLSSLGCTRTCAGLTCPGFSLLP